MNTVPTLNSIFATLSADVWPSTIAAKTLYDYNCYYANHIKTPFGDLPLDKITAPMLRQWQGKFSGSPSLANRCLSIISRCFRYAEEMELRPQGMNPCALIKQMKEHKRERYADVDEIRLIKDYLERREQEGGAALRHALFCKAMLYTGSRPSALERIKWGDLRMQEGGGAVATIDGKTGRETIVFPRDIVSRLELMPKNGELIFGKTSYRWFWDQLLEFTNIRGLWLRDLRRTFATFGFSLGSDVGLISELLNHSDPRTTKIYAKLMPLARVQAVEIIAEGFRKLPTSTSRNCK